MLHRIGRQAASLVIAFTLTCLMPLSLLAARTVHYFDCTNCHRGGISYTDLGNAKTNICLRCHKDNPLSIPLNDGTIAAPTGLFNDVDASNALGSYPAGLAPGDETSHMWAAKDANPAAGAAAPSNRRFFGRYGITTGKVACSRCHDPHGQKESNPQLLKLGVGTAEAMCRDCHKPWDQSENRGWLTHPLVADYAAKASAAPGKLRSVPGSGGAQGEIRLVDGGVSCTSCHGAHFTDSDASTVDGKGKPLSRGGGKLLRADGPQRADRSSLCQACHTYLPHGDAEGEQLGCLVCHSGHSYHPQTPNYFVLRNNTSTTTFGAVAGLDYSSGTVLDPALKRHAWGDNNNTTATGFCERCHGEHDTHGNNQDCTSCHLHQKPGNTYSFEANCTACHAHPPVWGSHQAHTSGGRMSKPLGCAACHATSQHRNDLSEVRYDPADPRLTDAGYADQGGNESSRYLYPGGYGQTPAYGNCSTLYCHSAGLPFDKANTYQQPTWGGGAQSCASCHAAGGVSSGMSDRHDAHLSGSGEKPYAFDCVRCHATTVNVGQTIKDPALHVNREKDVAFSAGGSYDKAGRGCASTYCHGNGRPATDNSSPACTANATTGCHYADRNNDGVKENLGNQTTSTPQPVKWSEPATLTCTSCHKGRPGVDARNAQMDSNGHFRLANVHWIRQYPCHYCHAATVSAAGAVTNFTLHANGDPDIAFDPKWAIGSSTPTYDKTTKVCDNLYCHSDGTTVNPQVREFPWDQQEHADCDTCHGHDQSDDCSPCHGSNVPQWAPEDQWKRAMPMYANGGPASPRANSHLRHLETDFSCENCHFTTVVGACGSCHGGTVPAGQMTEVGHVDASVHVDTFKTVVFRKIGSSPPIADPVAKYDRVTKKCSGTACHTGSAPVWGQSVDNDELFCLTCHGTTEADVDDYDAFNGTQGRINMAEWFNAGHGRQAASGPYPTGNPDIPGNPPANFPGNPCWYCHDNEVLHKDAGNPFRLKLHPQFEARFEKECVYCHMERADTECLGCHNASGSLSPQLSAIRPPDFSVDHTGYAGSGTSCLTSGCHLPQDASQCRSCHANPGYPAKQLEPGKVSVGVPTPPYSKDHADYAGDATNCLTAGCHTDDAHIHNTGAGIWNARLKADIKLQYKMMGVCLQCHDNDDNGRCNSCHTGSQYVIGYDPPGPEGFKTGSSKASSTHFGFKHFADYQANGVWRGGKFCWDCHDPHGDTNIYMIQNKVATETNGTFGVPTPGKRAAVTFKKKSGSEYAQQTTPNTTLTGICNVCHQGTGHYRNDYGDGHQSGRICTSCHNHGFGDSHSSGQSCNSCHQNKPISTHTGFSQPRDCTKCHQGAILKRMDIMRQFRAQSHHVQGVTVTNQQCYACHWEATAEGLINPNYHEGYNYKTHQGTPNAKSDLVVWGAQERPARYELGVTAQTFVATKIGTAEERTEVAKVSTHCLSCHSDQNNDIQPFADCKTPRQYAWDRSSIGARYSDSGTTNWGKYTASANAAKKIQTKAYSAHGNAVTNQGGWSTTTGEDGTLPNTRAGSQNVQCFDCHSSHGSTTPGVTSSYISADGQYSGGNLKETQPGKGGYKGAYKAQAKTDGINPMNPGAAQCFDCHETADATRGTADSSDDFPWSYQSTYGASQPIRSYRDSERFGGGSTGHKTRFPYRNGQSSMGGHLKASAPLVNAAKDSINRLCTPCHDPHGVSPSLGSDKSYAVPLLKGTWMTSPYKDDSPQKADTYYSYTTSNNISIDRKALGTTNGASSGPPNKISQSDSQFAGLCLRCHPKGNLTDGVKKNTSFMSLDRVHETVSGWGNNAEHNFTCSKCHNAHSSGLGRLMRTNCIDTGRRSGAGAEDWVYFLTMYNNAWPACHAPGQQSQQWNTVTPW